MILSGLLEGRLLKRYKRFLADVELADGNTYTVHCPNPGSMLGLAQPGSLVYLAPAAPKSKLPYAWRFVEVDGGLVCIDTMVSNRLFKEAFQKGVLTEFAAYDQLQSEYSYGDSRFDFRLSKAGQTVGVIVEVKSTTLLEEIENEGGQEKEKEEERLRYAAFPDARTERGRKHLNTLRQVALGEGDSAVQYYIVNRTDTKKFRPADSIDPDYGKALREAKKAGVQILCRDTTIDLIDRTAGGACQIEIKIGTPLPVIL
ncbi:MAG: DNA/RNA nuclease SfsA [Candidatus Melainabacteria bacterium]|nr:DNA/RNA nuclease SfsA [Candidatus Melainabacteria bacterium]OPZ89507.1 MAG: Sugar fermentation stimulation protein A [bacterium ADurb.Bin425]